MNYKIKFFYNGRPVMDTECEAPNPDLAAKRVGKPTRWNHMRVEGKTFVRYNRKCERVRAEPVAYKIQMEGTFPAILIMIGNLSEIYIFESKSKRNGVFACITSTSAEYAETEAEPTDITASSEGISASKSGLMSPTTWSGSVTNATWQDLLTRESIAKNSGTGKSEDTDTSKCLTGYKVSLSRPNRTFLATVKDISYWPSNKWPGTNNAMIEMRGQTIKVEEKDAGPNGKVFTSVNWMWMPEWLDFDHITALIKPMPEGTMGQIGQTTIMYHGERYLGKKISLSKCKCGCGAWYHDGHFFVDEWLEVE